jgi:hypothetical protein
MKWKYHVELVASCITQSEGKNFPSALFWTRCGYVTSSFIHNIYITLCPLDVKCVMGENKTTNVRTGFVCGIKKYENAMLYSLNHAILKVPSANKNGK